MIGRQLWLLLTRRDWRGDASAYLDDELTPRQRNQFEARLARSNEMQEYLDDLRQMRTALRGYAAESVRAPFQITPEMLASQTAAPLRTTRIERALRLSMATAAVGVATFTAVLIFDAVDRPTVTFTTTSAGDTRAAAPAAQVAVERATAQESAAGGSAVAVASIASSASQQRQQTVAPAREAETTEPAEQATVSAYDADQDSQAEQAETAVQEERQEQALEQQQAAQESEWQQSAQEQAESAQAAAHQQAAADPTRRALTAGSANGEANEQEVSAADVVATQEEQSAQAAVAAVTAQEEEESPALDSADASEGQESAESADTDESGDDAAETADGQAAADAGTASLTATVTSSVRVVDSEWPLPQRPQSSSVQLASDPSWEAPLQIALAVVAFGSLLAWVVLTVMDRRRQT